MPELALDEIHGDAYAGKLDRMRVAQLMESETTPNPRCDCESAQLGPHGRARPCSTSRGPVDHAEQRPDRQLCASLKPPREVLESPVVHPGLAALVAPAVANEHRSTARIYVGLRERERLGDPEAGAPEHGDERSNTQAVWVATGSSHHRDDLLDSRWVGRIVHALVLGRAPTQVARQRRRRAATAGGVQH